MIDTKRLLANLISVGIFSTLSLWGSEDTHAETASLRGAIEKAAQTNPAVQAAWHAFEASDSGVRAAKGGYLPSLDLVAEKGSERTEDPQEVEESYDIESYRITLTQMLFDGFATHHEVKRQSYIRLTRYYEFKNAAEELGLETAQAYMDVLRFRELVQLAKDNYFQHLRYHRDIEKRVTSGLGRGVDLEQAKARLALAESNVLTETTNLHDVSVRYQRLTGVFPEEEMHSPELPEGVIPSSRVNALNRAFKSNPELNASIENIRSNRSDYKGKQAPYMPRLDLRLRKQIDDNTRGTLGSYDEEAVELVMSYNLYNGGSDKARRKQAKYLMLEAYDNRDRVCREVRQTVSIAYNDIDSKARLIGFLERNLDAISKARAAYRNQFDIGQRTLLDLLDTENEYFEVERTLTNARYDLTLAKVRTLAGMGLLLYSMDVESLDKERTEKLDFSREDALSARCPAEAPAMKSLDFDVKKILSENRTRAPLKKREVMSLDVKFKTASAELTDENSDEIYRVANFLCQNPKLRGVVEGHTDSQGSDSYNQQLSQARSESVQVALIKVCPSAQGRLSAVGYGEVRPIARNDTALGRATNRRVELVLEAQMGDYTIGIEAPKVNDSAN